MMQIIILRKEVKKLPLEYVNRERWRFSQQERKVYEKTDVKMKSKRELQLKATMEVDNKEIRSQESVP